VLNWCAAEGEISSPFDSQGRGLIVSLGQAKAEAYRAGVESLGSQGYTVMQLMQIVGERNVRIVPDVAVSGTGGSTGLVDGLLGLMVRDQATKQNAKGD